MTREIIITSPGHDITYLLEKVKAEFDLNLVICETTFEEAVDVVREIIKKDPNQSRVIISGGVTLKFLRDHIRSIPSVSFFPNEYDLLITLEQALKSGKKVGLLIPGHEKIRIINRLCSVLQLSPEFYVYNNWRDIPILIENAHQDGVEVVVGTGDRIGTVVQQKGLEYLSVVSGENTVRKAIRRARYIVESEQRAKIATEHVKDLAIHSKDGVIALNEKKKFYIFNPIAAQFFRLSENEVLGRSLEELKFCPDLMSLFDDFEKKLEYTHYTQYGGILVNKIPFIRNEHESSILVNFREIINKDKVENIVNKPTITRGLVAKHHFTDIIHNNSKMSEVIQKAQKYASTDCIVLIKGETGTGKELISQSIHNAHTKRCKNPFVAVNCALLDENLLKSELFGYTEGAFTGASKGGKPGLFELAEGGTIFLDEIGKMKWELQASLLRVLQEKEVRRIGSDRVIPVDVRVIAASNEDLQDLVKKGLFREDLYYRLNVLKLTLPPLRDRRGDIPPLVTSLLKKLSHKYNKSNYVLSESVLEKISNFNWQGNIRQLEHFIERCVVLSDNENTLQDTVLELLDEEFMIHSNEENDFSNEGMISVNISTLDEMNTEIVRKLKDTVRLSNSELALKLGISRPTLNKILNKHLGLTIR